MKYWRKRAYLFAINFDVLYGDEVCIFLGTDKQMWNARIIKKRGHEPYPDLKTESYVALDVCKLIARRPEDMTEEEAEHIATNIIGSGVITKETEKLIFMEKLSMGILPEIFSTRGVTFKSKHKV